MRHLRAFVRPRWVALTLVVVGFAVSCFWVLAPWQLGKNSRTEARNDQIKSALAKAVVPIGALGSNPIDADHEWREVTLDGRFLVDKQAVVRLRSVSDSPAYEVLTPFATEAGTYLVNRGYVRPVQGTNLPSINAAPTDSMQIRARIHLAERTAPGRGARIESGTLQVYSIDPGTLGPALGVALAPGYLQMSPDQSGALGEVPVPQLDSGPYLSYGLQWLAFGVMAPLGLAYFVITEVRQRRATVAATHSNATSAVPRDRARRSAATRQSLAAAATDHAPRDREFGAIGVGAAPEATDSSVRAKLADRYGGD